MDAWLINLLNGITMGAVLFLVASGLSIALGVMGIVNLAHGTLFMVGALVGWTVAVQNGWNFWIAVIAGGIAAGLLGLILERGFLRHLYKQPNDQVLLTFGFLYIITNLAQWIWGAQPRPKFTTPELSGSVSILDYTYPISRFSIIAIGLIAAIALWWLQEKTRTGAIVRAGMDDKEMIGGLGVNLRLVSGIVFFLGSFVAGSAGVVAAQMLGVSLELGVDILLMALVVVIVGGVGSVQGALAGGMLIGVVDAFGKALFPDLAMFTIYFLLVLVLLVKPSGLAGRGV